MSTETYMPGEYDAVPHDFQAEQAVLGAMLLSVDALAEVTDLIVGTDFFDPKHQLIFDAIVDLFGQGVPVDPITVSTEMTKAGTSQWAGGPLYLHTLTQSTPTAANGGYYAANVAAQATLRRVAEAGTRLVQLSRGAVDGDVIARVSEIVSGIEGKTSVQDWKFLEELLAPTLDELEAIGAHDGGLSGVATGFADLDSLTSGLHPGQMIVLAGRPGSGKSTLGLDIARNAAIKHKVPTVIFSLEMSGTEITMRLLSAEAKVPLHKMRSGQMDDDMWVRLARRQPQIADAPLIVDDSPNLTMAEIRVKARRLKKQHGIGLIVIDYLQLMSGGGGKKENRQQEVSEMSRNLKLLAKELEVPIIAMSQLNRGAEQRSDKMPQLSDLRESGSIEQDADVVILLHREDLYDKESDRAGEADLIVAKHRNGPTATVVVAFQGHYSRFADLDQSSR